jgi:hypothetical protein
MLDPPDDRVLSSAAASLCRAEVKVNELPPAADVEPARHDRAAGLVLRSKASMPKPMESLAI